MEIVLIAAVAANGVIGSDGEMPWDYPADLARFRETTMGHPVVMGRKTYQAIEGRLGGPLPGRTNIVLSRGDPVLPAGVLQAGSIEEATGLARDAADGCGTVFVIGGATVFGAFLPRADRLLVTEIHAAHEGDTYFPERDPDEWQERDRERQEAFDFVEYVRRTGQ